MMAVTHMAIGATAAVFALSPNPWVIGLAILGSQLPDIDTSKSWIGSVLFPLSGWIEKRYPHRTVTHCLLATAVIAAVSAAVGIFLLPELLGNCWPAIPIAHLASCFSDAFTKQGVQLFYPKPVWCVCGINPNRRLSTGSVGEYSVLVLAIIALAINIQFSASGGWIRSASQAIGLRDGAIEVYNSEAGKHHVFAEVKGVWVADRTRADGRYWILGVEAGEFVLTDGKGIYKTATNIVSERLVAKVEGVSTTTAKTLSFTDQEPQQQLQQLQLDNPQSAIYISGSVNIDFPEDIPVTAIPKQLQTFSLAGNQATLNYSPIESTVIQLTGQYVTGSLNAKIITPKPL